MARIPIDTQWEWRERVWTGGGALHLLFPEAEYAIWALWSEGHAGLTWYVNLQTPVRRTWIGFDFTDQILDLVISADLTDWHWKDEDELAEACGRGLLSVVQANAIRATGERVLASIQRGQPPFDLAWSRWVPDPHWPIPVLPAAWSQTEPPRIKERRRPLRGWSDGQSNPASPGGPGKL